MIIDLAKATPQTAYCVRWTATSVRTGQVIIDATLASGYVRTRELAERIAVTERLRAAAMDAALGVVYTSSYQVCSEPVAGHCISDELYTEAWFMQRAIWPPTEEPT